ncbi:MAG: DNA repair protein RecN [Ilumatobacteraceae bacterium]
MLTELHIEDLGIIDRLDLVFGEGLVVLTGETGAGKTMLIEAISLLVGGRADAARVRAGATEARIEGRFVVGDVEHIMTRVVPLDGRSRAYVDGRLATVGQLADLGTTLVDLHGQHTHQSLLSMAVQRASLDQFAGTDLEPLRLARGRITEIDASLAALGGDAKSRAREIDLLRFQVDEIASLGITDPDEDRRLEADEDVLADATAHREAGEAAIESLNADGAAADALGAAIAGLTNRAPFAHLVGRLRDVAAEVADIASELRAVAESCEDDPERLAAVRARRRDLRELQRKYGDSLTEVMSYHDESAQRLAELESFEVRVAELETKRTAALKAERKAAATVAASRRGAAATLGESITAHLAELAMERAVVRVEVSGDDPADEVVFLLAANPGSPAAPLAKVASGGELARTMLAIRMVLTEGPPILIFDEVDAGIGGAAANAVARCLARLAESHQVFVVTHLAQVAALARQHIVVRKEIVSTGGADYTRATVESVAGNPRIDEIARMLSGRPDSAAARRHARELLAG